MDLAQIYMPQYCTVKFLFELNVLPLKTELYQQFSYLSLQKNLDYYV